MLENNSTRLIGGAIAIVVAASIFLIAKPFASQGTNSLIDQVETFVYYGSVKEEKTGLTFTYDNNHKTVSVSGQSSNAKDKLDIDIPESIIHNGDAYKVTSIADRAFYNKGITSITLPSTIKSIGSAAFGYNKIQTLNLPDGLSTISDSAFLGNQITILDIPNSVTSIGKAAFTYNQINYLKLSDNISTIYESTFMSNKLQTVDIPNNVKEIKSNAFTFNNLASATLSSNTNYETDAFGDGTKVIIK